MHAFDVLGDPIRRRLLEMLAEADHAAGDVSAVVEREFGISQPAVSRHLRVLRENGFVVATADGSRRIYRLEPAGFDAIDETLARYRSLWRQRLDALGTEITRGQRTRAPHVVTVEAGGSRASRPDQQDHGADTRPVDGINERTAS